MLNNSYGTYWAINKFTTDNAGTVALVIKAITITYDPAVLAVREVIPGIEWEFTDIVEDAVAFNVWLYKEPEDYGPGWAIDPPWDFPGPVGDPFGVRSLIDNQIDPCNELLTEICVDVKQTAPECHTYLFDIEIYAENWDP